MQKEYDDGMPDLYLEYLTEKRSSSTMDWTTIPFADKLYDHQKLAVEDAIGRCGGRCGIAAGAGLGKTLIGLILAVRDTTKKVAIITPSSKMRDWMLELDTYFPDESFQLLTKSKDKITNRHVITSYEIAKRHDRFQNINWHTVIVDECQQLRNVCQRSDTLLPILQYSVNCYILSATPMMNRPSELYNYLFALYPEYFSSRRMFTRRYCAGFLTKSGVWDESGVSDLNRLLELNKLIKHTMFRISTKKALSDLKPVKRCKHWHYAEGKDREKLEAMEKQRRILAAQLSTAKTQSEYAAAKRIHTGFISKMYLRTGLIKTRLFSSKCLEIVRDGYEHDRIVFFTHHVDVAERLRRVLVEYEPLMIDGTTPKPLRQSMIKRIQTGLVKVSILTLNSCGEGITLSPGANVIVFVENDKTPTMMEQGEARVYRIGTTKDVIIHWLLLANSEDERIYTSIQQKKQLIGIVMDGVFDDQFTFDCSTVDEVEIVEDVKRIKID